MQQFETYIISDFSWVKHILRRLILHHCTGCDIFGQQIGSALCAVSWEAMQEEQLKLEKAEAQIQVLKGGPIGFFPVKGGGVDSWIVG